MKYLIVIIVFFLMGCENNNKLSDDSILWEFHPKNHQDQWDLQAFQLVNEYQSIQNNFTVSDSLAIKTAVQQLINLTDTILVGSTNTDSLTQNTWVLGLQTFKNELEALILETEPVEKKAQLNMCTVSFIHFLADIGYTKTNIYIFQKPDEDDAYFWFGTNKTSKNPLDQTDRKEYNASFTLQDP